MEHLMWRSNDYFGLNLLIRKLMQKFLNPINFPWLGICKFEYYLIIVEYSRIKAITSKLAIKEPMWFELS